MIIRKIAAVLALSLTLTAAPFFTGQLSGHDSVSVCYADEFDYDEDLDDSINDGFDYVDEFGVNDEDADYGEKNTDKGTEKAKRNPVMVFAICLIIGLLIAFIAVGSMKAKLKTVHKQLMASDYKKENSFKMRESHDTFLSKRVNKSAKPQSK